MRRERPLNRAVYESSPQRKQRYWNEFDDGEEIQENKAYTVYIDPNASSFPGTATVSRLADAVKSTTQKLKSRFRCENSRVDERVSLLENERSISQSSTDSSDIENGRLRATFLPHIRNRRSLTLLQRALPHDNTRDAWVTLASVISLILSFVLLFLDIILVMTGRRKAVAETDIGVLVGAAFSLALGVGGLVGFAVRSRRASWIWLTVASLLFIPIIVGNSVLLVQVL